MKAARLLGALACAALVSGCASPSTADHQPLPLYLHFGFYGDAPGRLLSTRVEPGTPFFVGGDLAAQLRGVVQRRGDGLFADVQAGDGGQFAVFCGPIELERPFLPTGGASSGGAGALWFLVSTNAGWEASLEVIQQEYRKMGGVMESADRAGFPPLSPGRLPITCRSFL
ncbi:MAG: hypothetical protein ACKVYV_10870 [Limisphaerales bacterium]